MDKSYILEETNTTVTVPKDHYKHLMKRDFKLDCLEQGGIDNWPYYHDSLEDGGYFNYKDN